MSLVHTMYNELLCNSLHHTLLPFTYNFTGSLLMKIGFGLASEAERTNTAWKQALEDSKKAAPYQVRVHVYQGN